MIYTITTNPSLDYYLYFSKTIVAGEHNRSNSESYDAGGKGVNVSIFLNNLGIQSACLGFLGGFTKDYYLDRLKKYSHIQPLFTNIKDNTRINIKTMDGVSTSLNALGPHITDEEFSKFTTRAKKIYDDDYIVLSGMVQDELNDRIEQLVSELSSVGTKVILDTDTDLTEECLKYNPYLVKLNDQNTGVDENEIISKAKDYISKGCKCVIYSSPIIKDYYLITEEKNYKASREELNVSTGSGDSMIAGFLYSNLRGASPEESFKYAVACSKTLSLNDDNVDRSMIEAEFDKVNVTEF